MMKRKRLYAILAALIIIMLFVTIWISREAAKILSVSQEVKPEQVTQQPSALSDYTEQLPALSKNRHAITIIKPAPKEEPPAAAEEAEEKIKESQQTESLSAPTAQSPVSPEVSQEESDNLASEVTTGGKYPSQAKKQEMNVRGIVMY